MLGLGSMGRCVKGLAVTSGQGVDISKSCATA